tara:strand:+ start:169 stop:342 length:174 start_codon:yes stop_codon:yes gene_type:complete
VKIGDLIIKIKGYRPKPPDYFAGIVVGFVEDKVIVSTEEPFLERWIKSFCTVVQTHE